MLNMNSYTYWLNKFLPLFKDAKWWDSTC
jgi:hypothetical protein